jgi:membrane associated rhomboid family serine protease
MKIDIEKIINYFSYNSIVILSFFFISLLVLILNRITHGKANRKLFSSERAHLLNPFTYIRLVTHIFGHDSWEHFMSNFMYILLIGPMIEEKYGSINLIKMIALTAIVTGLINMIFSKNKRILGSSGIAFMLIILSSFVNMKAGKIPITLVLIILCYIMTEVKAGLFNKKDNVSHISHLIGAVCGGIYGFYIF